MPDDNRTALHKQNSSKNLEVKLSTDNKIVMGKAQNKEKTRKEIFVIFKAKHGL